MMGDMKSGSDEVGASTDDRVNRVNANNVLIFDFVCIIPALCTTMDAVLRPCYGWASPTPTL